MTTKERLHQLIEELPEEEFSAAERLLEALRHTGQHRDPILELLARAPLDDEPLSDEDRAAHRAGMEEYRAGRSRPLRETAP